MALSGTHDEGFLIADYFAAQWRTGVMVDVGAQFGSSFRDYLRRGWRVIAFEPDPSKFASLARFETNSLLTLVRAAVGDTAASNVQFYTSPESTGIASIVPFRPSHVAAATVDVVTLRDVLPACGVEQIDYLKIDTEGYDLAVLRGVDWDRARPEIVMAEFDELKTRQLGHSFRALGDFLQAAGYTVFCSQWHPIERYGGTHAWHSITTYPCDLHHADAWGNFVAVRADAHVESMARLVALHA